MKDIQEALSAALGFLMAVELAKADGKLELVDIAHFASPLLKLPAAVEGIGNVVEQFKNATPEDRASVITALSAEFDMANDVLEAKIESGLEWLMATGKFVGTLKVS